MATRYSQNSFSFFLIVTLFLACANPPYLLAEEETSVLIPNVKDLDVQEAEPVIEGAGLRARIKFENSPFVPAGLVIDQIPPGGSTARSDSEVKLIVSRDASTGQAIPFSWGGEYEVDVGYFDLASGNMVAAWPITGANDPNRSVPAACCASRTSGRAHR